MKPDNFFTKQQMEKLMHAWGVEEQGAGLPRKGKHTVPSFPPGELVRVIRVTIADQKSTDKKTLYRVQYGDTLEELMGKQFKVGAIASNMNSFGLTGIVLVALDGEAWEAGRCLSTPGNETKVGDVITLPVNAEGVPTFATKGFEIPRKLERAPHAVVKELWSTEYKQPKAYVAPRFEELKKD